VRRKLCQLGITPLVLLRGVAVFLTGAVVSAEFMHRVFRNKETASFTLYLQTEGSDMLE
jgi:hypothetical protein